MISSALVIIGIYIGSPKNKREFLKLRTCIQASLELDNVLYLNMSKTKRPVRGKYIDPLVDFAFKKIFGSEPNKDLLIDFLNEVFRGRKHIVDLSYDKNEHPGEVKDEGSAVFDLLCTGNNGERFLIEVQRAKQGYFKKELYFILLGSSAGWLQKANAKLGVIISTKFIL